MMKTFAVTGANGYLGGHVCRFLNKRNCKIIFLQRAPDKNKTVGEYSFFSLEDSINPEIFKNADVLVHCAYDPTPITWKKIEEINVQGAIRLFQAAVDGGIKQIIYISSMSAFDNCKSLYGQAKLAIEKELTKLGEGGIIIRPGLIFGGHLGGFLSAVKSFATRLPLIPLIGSGDQMLHFSNIEDLCELIFKLTSNPNLAPCMPIMAACEKGKPFKEIVKLLAHQENKSPLLIPMPWQIAWLGLKALEWSGIRIGFRSDSIVGLVHYNPYPDFNTLKGIGLSFRNFD